MDSNDNARLESFGISGLTSPEERNAEYIRQCKGLSQRLRAKFWLMILEKDPEVAKLRGVGPRPRRRTKRRGRR